MIINYEKQRTRLNNPQKHRLIAESWKPVTDAELLSYLAIYRIKVYSQNLQ